MYIKEAKKSDISLFLVICFYDIAECNMFISISDITFFTSDFKCAFRTVMDT